MPSSFLVIRVGDGKSILHCTLTFFAFCHGLIYTTRISRYKGSAMEECSVLGMGAKVLKMVSLVKNLCLT